MELFSTTPGRPGVLRRHVQRASAHRGRGARDDRASSSASRCTSTSSRSASARGRASRSCTRGSACRSSSAASARSSSRTSSRARSTSYDDLLANDVELFTGYRRELMQARHLRAAAEPEAQPLLVRAHGRRRRPAARGDRGRGHDRPGAARDRTRRLLHDRPRGARASRSGACSTRRSRTPAAGRTASSRSRRSRTATARRCSSRAATTATSTRARSPRCGSCRRSTRRRSRPDRRHPGDLDGRVEGEHAHVAVGRELQPLVPRPARRAAQRAARRLLHARAVPAWPTS